MDFTGERYIPTFEDPQISLEHWHRYLMASKWVKGKRVLDVACGEGYGSMVLAQNARSVVGVDVDRYTVRHASSKYLRDNLEFSVGDLRHLGDLFPAGTFDVIVSYETLEHVDVEVQRTFVASVHNLLSPQGVFLVSTPNRLLYSDEPQYHNAFHVSELYRDEFEKLLESHFSIVDLYGQNIVSGSYLWPTTAGTEFYEYQLGLTIHGFRPVDEPKPALYFVAVCYKQPDAPVRPTSLLLDGAQRLIGLRNEMINKLQNDVSNHQTELATREEEIASLQRELDTLREEITLLQEKLASQSLPSTIVLPPMSIPKVPPNWYSQVARHRNRDLRMRWHTHSLAVAGGELSKRMQTLQQGLVDFETSRTWHLAQRIQTLRTVGRSPLSLLGLRTEIRQFTHTIENVGIHIGDLTQQITAISSSLRAIRAAKALVLAQWIASAPRALRGRTSYPSALDSAQQTLDGIQTSIQILAALEGENNIIQEIYPLSFPTTDSPHVSIIIPVYNNVLYTFSCLSAILEANDDVSYEVIVVDDQATDDTPTMLSQMKGIHVVTAPQNSGFIAACNLGRSAARAPILVFLNNDAQVRSGWLSAIVGTFRNMAKAGIVGAKLLYPSGQLQEAGGVIWADATGWNVGRLDDPSHPQWNYARQVDYTSGACLAIRTDLFDILEGFDAYYAPAYYEDTDLAFRARKMGFQVWYQPFCEVVHHEGITSGTDISQGIKRYQEINRHKFFRRWQEVLATHQLSATDLPAALTRYTRGRILVVDHMVPTPDRDSGSVRMSAILGLLREMGWHVTLLPENLFFVAEAVEPLQLQGIEVVYAPYVTKPETFLQERGSEFDLIWLSRVDVAERIIPWIKHYCSSTPIVFDTVDLHYLRLQRQAVLLDDNALMQEANKMRERELNLARQVQVTVVVSPIEQTLLTNEDPALRVEIVSNIHEPLVSTVSPHGRRGLLFVGGFSHPPNIDAIIYFSRHIYPIVRQRLGDVPLYIVGADAPAEITQLGRMDGVKVVGYVQDLTPWFEKVRLMVAPLRYGAGVKGKINLSMSYGVPVVASPIAVEGMYLHDGQDVLVADPENSEVFSDAVAALYLDDALWEQISIKGLATLVEHFSSEMAQQGLQRVMEYCGVIREEIAIH